MEQNRQSAGHRSIEQLTASTILEAPIARIDIGGSTYEIKPPTTATLVMVSGIVSTLPAVEYTQEEDVDVLRWVLAHAPECGDAIGKVAATLILGARRILESPEVEVEERQVRSRFSWRRLRSEPVEALTLRRVNERDHLASLLMRELTAASLKEMIFKTLLEAGVSDFFALTTSLSTRNILMKTRTEVDAATASGHS